jgi:hypothetical protein
MFKEFTVQMIIFSIAGIIWQAIAILAPQATLYMYTNKPVQIGITQIPCNMSGVIGGYIIPFFVHKIKYVRYQIMLALVIQAVFTTCYGALIPAHKNTWMIFQMFGECYCTWTISPAYNASGLFVPEKNLEYQPVSPVLFATQEAAWTMPFLLQSQTTFLTSRSLPVSQLLPSAGYAPAYLATLIPAVSCCRRTVRVC